MLEFARQDSFVQLVEVNELDQVRESGVPVVKAEEHLPIVLILRDTRTLTRLETYLRGRKRAHGQRLLQLPVVRFLHQAHGSARRARKGQGRRLGEGCWGWELPSP